MNLKEIREFIKDRYGEGPDAPVYFTEPSYDTAFIGMSDDDRCVYSFTKMVEWVTAETGDTSEDGEIGAIEFIEYNTIRALPYAGERGPIVVYDNPEL